MRQRSTWTRRSVPQSFLTTLVVLLCGCHTLDRKHCGGMSCNLISHVQEVAGVDRQRMHPGTVSTGSREITTSMCPAPSVQLQQFVGDMYEHVASKYEKFAAKPAYPFQRPVPPVPSGGKKSVKVTSVCSPII